jgi:hypothetical protein
LTAAISVAASLFVPSIALNPTDVKQPISTFATPGIYTSLTVVTADRARSGTQTGAQVPETSKQRLQLRVVQRIRQRPGQASATRPAEVVADEPWLSLRLRPITRCGRWCFHCSRRSSRRLSHRQSLARHFDPLLLGKRSKRPSVEDCQRQPTRKTTSGMIRIDRNAHGSPPRSVTFGCVTACRACRGGRRPPDGANREQANRWHGR